MNIENSILNTTVSQIKISEKDLKELFSKNQSKIITILNESYIAFGLLDIIDKSNTSNVMKLKIESILKEMSLLEQKI
jgi:arsenate reductase-like glutaredoxin family protein